jgi:hypothetical protein
MNHSHQPQHPIISNNNSDENNNNSNNIEQPPSPLRQNHMQQHHHPHPAPPPMIMMERLLYNLHYKCCTYALQTTSRKSRFYAEHTILIIAICCFGALLLSHRTFVFYPSSVTPSTYNNHQRSQHDFSSSSTGTIHHSHSQHNHHRHYIPTQCLKSIPGFIADTNIIDVTHLILINDDDFDDDDDDSRQHTSSYTIIQNRNRDYDKHQRQTPTTTAATQPEYSTRDSSSSTRDTMEECRNEDSSIHHTTCTSTLTASTILRKNDRIMFSYAREKGYLFLSSSTSSSLSSNTFLPISTQYVYISKHDSLCFGEPFVQYLIFHLLYYILGPDTVMINWILGTFYHPTGINNTYNNNNTTGSDPYLDATYHSGYIYNPRTSDVIDIEEYKQQLTHYSGSNKANNNHHRHWWIKRKLYELGLKFLIVIKTSFLFFITTTLVSFTLRETQGRMLQFTHTLQQQCFNPNTDHQNNANDPNAQHHHHQLNYNVIVQLIMTHVMENVIFVPIIVGFIYFLINFYNGDKFLAFMVLTLVWVCESFSMVRYVQLYTL